MDPLNLNEMVWGFTDESAQRINANTVRVWSKGKPVRKMNSDRVNVNVFGFYAVQGGSVIAFPGSSKKEDMCVFLDAVRDANGDRIVLMILDNSRIHHAKMVTEYAEELGIILLFLPPYSPQFNPIEFIWKTVKAVISGLFLLCKEHLVATVRETFMEEAEKQSYAEGWKKTFLTEYFSKKLGS